MKYLIVSCTLFDGGGLAMIRGAMNGLSRLDPDAEFRSLHRPVHHRPGIMDTFEEPVQNDEAFAWADVILNIAGLFGNQHNMYDWLRLRRQYDKPLVYMSQSFKVVDPVLLEGTRVVARGPRSAATVRAAGHEPVVAPDLSFLVEPVVPALRHVRRAFVTHKYKEMEPMFAVADRATDVQVITCPPKIDGVEPEPLLGIETFAGSVEENFGVLAEADEVHAARYQAMCAAILSGKRPVVYATKDDTYNLKYDDLLELCGTKPDALRAAAMRSCDVAYEFATAWYRDRESAASQASGARP